MTGLEPATSWSLTRCATNCATSRGPFVKGIANIGIVFRKSKDLFQRFLGGQRFLPRLQGGLEGRGGAEATDGAVDDGERAQVFLQFVGGEAGIEAGQFGGEQGEAVPHAQGVVVAEILFRPAEEGEAGADFLFHHGGVRGGCRGGVADALAAGGADAGLFRGREEDGVSHTGGLRIGLESIPEGFCAEDEGGDGRHSPIDEDVRENLVRAGAEAPFLVRFREVPMEDVIGVVAVDTAAHPLDAGLGEVHARGEEAHPFRVGGGVQAAFPEGLAGLFHRHDRDRETGFEIRRGGADGGGAGEVHDDGAEGGVLLEGKHREGPVEGVEVPGRNDEGDLSHRQRFNLCKDSKIA